MRQLSRRSSASITVSVLLIACQWCRLVTTALRIFPSSPSSKSSFDHDLVVVGAGASGLFAAGTASSLGCKTLLLDNNPDSVVGGDCTNAACVPSKAVRSVARMAAGQRSSPTGSAQFANEASTSWLRLAQRHSADTVEAVRQRENSASIAERNPNLDLLFVESCRFLSSHELQVVPRNSTAVTVRSKQFLIATGASPIVPRHIEEEAKAAGLPLFTYRTALQPGVDDAASIWSVLEESCTVNQTQATHLVVVGGGPTACELGQTLARLTSQYQKLVITLVAPSVLSGEDVIVRNAAMKVLQQEGIRLRINRRVSRIELNENDRIRARLDDDSVIPVDVMLLCMGRSPETSLTSLNLAAANVPWTPTDGILVHPKTLRSTTATNIYACGDCCSAIIRSRQRRAAHAAWTGFHAARNVVIPAWFRVGSKAVHSTVPAVIYTDPELAAVGLSYTECVRKYGQDGFDCVHVPEEGMDRADMERLERPMLGFVELRATKVHGVILGMTACGPAAAEHANEVGLAISSRLTVRDLARAIHSYPSHGYLLHRIALAMATGNAFGLLAALGPLGRMGAASGRLMLRLSAFVSAARQNGSRLIRSWEAEGAAQALVWQSTKGSRELKLRSYLDIYRNETLLLAARKASEELPVSDEDRKRLMRWIMAFPEVP